MNRWMGRWDWCAAAILVSAGLALHAPPVADTARASAEASTWRGSGSSGAPTGDEVDVATARNAADASELRLEIVGHLGGPITAVACDGARCYVGLGHRVAVVDVDDPERPRLRGETALLPAHPDRLAALGDRAYVLTRDEIVVVDATDPDAPSLAGATDDLHEGYRWFARSFVVVGTTLYVVGDGPFEGTARGWLRVVDAADPRRPRSVGSLSFASEAGDVDVIGDRAYVALGHAGIRIVDVSVATAPREIGSVPEVRAAAVSAVPGRLFALDGGELRVIDVGEARAASLLGEWHGATGTQMRVVRDRAFVFGDSTGVQIVDVTDPGAMVAIGTYPVSWGVGMAVRASGQIVVATSAGLEILDASTVRPARVDGAIDFDVAPVGMRVHERYAYVALGADGLRIVDVRDPTTPVEVGRIDTPGEARSAFVADGTAYVADGAGGLRIVDVRDPTAPRAIGAWAGGQVEAIAADGAIAYAMGRDALWIIDVGEPTAPRELARMAVPFHPLVRLAVAGAHVYRIAAGIGVDVVDVSLPSRPAVVTTIASPSASDLALDGDGRLYVTTGGWIATPNSSLEIYDVREPSQPRRLSVSPLAGRAAGVDIDGAHVVVIGRDGPAAGRWVRRIDVADPARPLHEGMLELPSHPSPEGAPNAPGGDLTALGLEDEHVFVTTDFHRPDDLRRGHLLAIDLREAVAARVTGALRTVTGGPVSVSGTHAYVLGADSLHVLDVAEPSAPREVGALTTLRRPVDLRAIDDRVFVAGDDGLRVVDAGDPTRPHEIGALDIGGTASDVDVAGRHAYLAAGARGLAVIDVGDPAHPREVARLDVGHAAHVAVGDRRVYVTGERFSVVDASDPTAPRITAALAGSIWRGRATVAGDRVFIASGLDESPLAIDCADPTAPRIVARWGSGSETDVAVAGDRLYAVDAVSLLRLFDVSDPARPLARDAIGLLRTASGEGPTNAYLDLAGDHVYATTARSGLSIVRTIERPVIGRVFLPIASDGSAPR